MIQEMARVMLLNKQIPQKFLGKAVNTSCHILNYRENLGKFDAKSDEGIFLGYSTTS